MLPFVTADDAEKALLAVEENYTLHSDAARSVAGEYFDSARVLGEMLERVVT